MRHRRRRHRSRVAEATTAEEVDDKAQVGVIEVEPGELMLGEVNAEVDGVEEKACPARG